MDKTRYILAGVILSFSVLAFGSVENWAQAVVGLLAIPLLVHCFRRFDLKDLPHSPAEIRWLILLLLLVLLTTIPLPFPLVQALSRETAGIWSLQGQTPFWTTISLNRYATLQRLSLLLSATALFAAFASGSPEQRRKLVILIAVLGTIVALIGIFGVIYPTKKVYWLRTVPAGWPVGPFINRNHFAGYLNLSFFLTVGLFFHVRARRAFWLFALILLCLAIMAAGLFASLSRSGVVGFGVGFLTLTVLLLFRRRNRGFLPWVLPILGLTMLLILYLNPQKVADRLATLRNPLQDPTAQMRLATWQGAARTFFRYPILGTGSGTAPVVISIYKTPTVRKNFIHTENEYLELLFETGLSGFLLAGGFLIAVLRKGFRTIRRMETPGDPSSDSLPNAEMATGALAAAAAGLGQAFFDFNLQMPALTLLFFGALGILAAPFPKIAEMRSGERSLGGTPGNLLLRRIPARYLKISPALIITAVFLAVYNLRAVTADYCISRAKFFSERQTDLAADYYRKAGWIDRGNPVPFYRFGRYEYEHAWKLSIIQNRPLADILIETYRLLQEGQRCSPADWRFPYYQALAAEWLNRLGYPEQRQNRDRNADLAIRLNPTEYRILIRLSEIYRAENPEKSELMLKRAREICPWA